MPNHGRCAWHGNHDARELFACLIFSTGGVSFTIVQEQLAANQETLVPFNIGLWQEVVSFSAAAVARLELQFATPT